MKLQFNMVIHPITFLKGLIEFIHGRSLLCLQIDLNWPNMLLHVSKYGMRIY